MRRLQQGLNARIYDSVILIVEDNRSNRLFLEETLRKRGYRQLHSVSSGEDALALLDTISLDLVLLDIIMPGGMDGYECCRAIRRHPRGQGLPVLMQTAIAEAELRAKAFACGANDFVSKPVYADELCARMQVHLEMRHTLHALQQYHTRVARELEQARLLQQSILPSEHELAAIRRTAGLDIASHYAPSSEIGGDFWGMKPLSAHRVAVWMVDFSGHGVASALNAFRLQAYLKEDSYAALNPAEYMTALNERLLQILSRGQFATMFYGVIDTQANALIYSCAAWPSPLLVRAGGQEVCLLDGRGFPLGIGQHTFETHAVPFDAGDALLLYSDALVETPDRDGRFIEEENIAPLLLRYRDSGAAETLWALRDYFAAHAAKDATDDLTLVLCKRTEEGHAAA